MSGHLPWAPSDSFFDSMKSQVNGVNISDNISHPDCCVFFGSAELYFEIPAGIRGPPYAKTNGSDWKHLPLIIAERGHEAGHVNGPMHVTCPGEPNAADPPFDINNISSYGIQWLTYDLFLNGVINVGYACQTPDVIADTSNEFLFRQNETFRPAFCGTKPPIRSMPSNPGGYCAGADISGFVRDDLGNLVKDVFVDAVSTDSGLILPYNNMPPLVMASDSSDGSLEIKRLNPGNYKLMIESDECFVPTSTSSFFVV